MGEFLSNNNSNSNSSESSLAIAIPIAIVLKMCNSNSLAIAIVDKKLFWDLSKGVITLLDKHYSVLDHIGPLYALLAQFERQKPLCRKGRL